MNPRELHVLGNRVLNHLPLLGHRVELDLLGILQEAGHHHWKLFRHVYRQLEKGVHLLLVVTDVHRRTR